MGSAGDAANPDGTDEARGHQYDMQFYVGRNAERAAAEAWEAYERINKSEPLKR